MNKLFLCLISVFCCVQAFAAPIDDAKKLYRQGKYVEAIKKLETLRKSSPKDGNVNYYLGAAYLAVGRTAEAQKPLTIAQDKGVAEAAKALAELAIAAYDINAADEHLEAWSEILNKRKNPNFERLDSVRSRLVLLRNMLDRVEKIDIVDTLNVDAHDFFTHYRLSPEAGQLLLPSEVKINAKTLAYLPQNNSELIWAEADSAGVLKLMSAGILDDGTLDDQNPLRGDFSGLDNCDYPFLMPDGMTLYFGATGPGSLGGYDIYMTRRGENGFLQAQNVGMPYNSFANDYLLAIDETTGAGWFASDRFSPSGQVTIYVFVPSATRVNHSPHDAHLAAKATLRTIDLVDTPQADELRNALQEEKFSQSQAMSAIEFALSMGNGNVYHRLDDFKNRQARSEMKRYLKQLSELDRQKELLYALREKYRGGDKSVADQILDAEANIDLATQALFDHRNKIIRLETK